MKQIHEKGLGKDEFLSPRDAASCIYNAISVDLPSDFIYAPLFVQSIPPTGRNARFDITNTTKLLNGWKPLDTFPSGIEEICIGREMNVQLKKRKLRKKSRKMPDPLVIGTIAVCIFIASQIAIRSKK